MSEQIPEETIDQIKKANDIVDIVGEYVSLKKQGRNYFGLCPFHGEKTPSFSVTQDKQIFHCFGCGKGGNVVTFLTEMEGYTFYQAIQYLAEKSGQVLPENLRQQTNQQYNEEDQAGLKAFDWLTKLYHHLLRHTKEGKQGYRYLLERGFSDETIDTFQLGYSPQSRDVIVQFLEKKGFHPQQMVKAGVLTANDQNQISDRFRGRVTFPIRNHLGRSVGFGGRTITDQEPKYLNSPESSLFQKGKLLYNFDVARSAIRKEGQAILFEGYMDVIAAHQAGILNGVATLGTSITEQQASLLKRYVDTVIICYDGDRAGIEASYKAAKLLRHVGCTVKIASIPDGLDPDSYIASYGAERFQHEIIEASSTYMTFLMRYIKKDFNLNLEGDRIQYIEKVIDEIAIISRPMEREHYGKELANEFDLSMDTILQEIRLRREKLGKRQDNAKTTSHTKSTESFKRKKSLLPAYHNAEKQLIAYMLHDSSIAEKVKIELGASFNVDTHKIIVTHLYAYYEEGYESDISHFIERIQDQFLKNQIVEIAMEPIHQDISNKEIQDYIRIIRYEQEDKTTIRLLRKEQKDAEFQKDFVKAAQIGMEILELQKKFKNASH
ncbi:DNA primase [Paraliobacillus quinghaiensis]|uniref:DNA primase n=1 Tax=Paraliobacillus quinghaiensis TaxID=470815 RepID=A0A917TP19_9BACI|nr:DNA primase [Paraliobacillus quinghaiensis]GGM31366.1 DNA primase [Paraliobacillus quinghaiensis]